MFSSFRLFRLFGTDVHINSSLFYMALFHFSLVVSSTGQFGGLNYAVPLYIAAFASILVHEYGHVGAAYLRGIGCRRITLHAIGGFAVLDRDPDEPLDEFLIAVAGPVTSLSLAFVFGLLIWLPLPTNGFVEKLLVEVAFVNLVIAVFNMLPAYPLDGGRVLHALLGAVAPRFWADRLCVVSGQLIAAALLVIGIRETMIVLILIALFVFASAAIGLGHRVFWFVPRKRRKPPAADSGIPQS